MLDLHDSSHTPTLEEICAYTENPLLWELCERMSQELKAACKIEFSKCSMAYGWNVKFRKGGKGLCTIYPDRGAFTVLVVIGPKEKDEVEGLLSTFSPAIQDLYRGTMAGNNQKWLMIERLAPGDVFDDVLRLIRIRQNSR